MGNGERSDSGGLSDQPVILATGVGTVAGATLALLSRRSLGSFWLGLLAFLLVTGIGAAIGRLVGGLLFRPADGGPPDHPPYA